MKRILAGIAAMAAVLAMAAPATQAAPATATIDVVYNADGSATITSSKGVSHYVVTLCDGTSIKVELSGADRTVTVGPFSSPIASITAKSATSVYTEANPAGCEKPPPPCDPKLDPKCEQPPPPPCDPKLDPKCEPVKP
jgi:hypothetical protein